jgi:hypothetical protein
MADSPPAEVRRFSKEELKRVVDAELAERAEAMWQTAQGGEKDQRGLYRKVGLPIMLGGIGADLATTHHVMKQGGREANPAYGDNASFGKVAAINAALAAGIALALDTVAKKHPKAATAAAAGIGGVRGAVAVRNLRQDD